MIVKNTGELLSDATEEERELREIAIDLINSAISAIHPSKLIRNNIALETNGLKLGTEKIPFNQFNKVVVVGGGKGSGFMAQEVEQILKDYILHGTVAVLEGTESLFSTKRIQICGSEHPIPSPGGVAAVEQILKDIRTSNKDDLVLCLISGGGSAILPSPEETLSLEDLQCVNQLLLESGATIHEINVVRKHLEKTKGGKLAQIAFPRKVVSLILSDVVGDSLDTIASGPTYPDASTFQDAMKVLTKYHLWDKIPSRARTIIEDGVAGKLADTPKMNDKIFHNVRNYIIGNNETACLAMKAKAEMLSFNATILSTEIEGEARHFGTILGSIAKRLSMRRNTIPCAPCLLIFGGETTVTVRGTGKGGRNQELCVAAAKKIDGLRNVLIASFSTDGIDGPTNAAGGIIDGRTLQKAAEKGLDVNDFLNRNDSYTFLKQIHGLLITGSTASNVADISFVLVL
ncbi:MAG: glycerate kinase [Candidatus Heimdallarchaeota archaeon]